MCVEMTFQESRKWQSITDVSDNYMNIAKEFVQS